MSKDETKAGRRNLAIGDTFHTVLKMIAASRLITMTQLTEEILEEGIRKQFTEDSTLRPLVEQLVARDEQDGGDLRDRTLDLIKRIMAGQA